LRGYHLHPESKFLGGDYTDRGPTRRRHVFVQAIEDIGKEADKWDDEEPLTADNEFTVTYGVSEVDRATMLAVIQSVSKRRLARAAKVSTRSIPWDEGSASGMSDVAVRNLFEEASALMEEGKRRQTADKDLINLLARRVAQFGLKRAAAELGYDPSNLLKILDGRRLVSGGLRRRLQERHL
jgi:hypothetical protein